MAGYECSLCSGQEQAVLLITPLTGGETMAVGPDCMAVGLAGMLAGHLGIDADKLWDAAQRLLTKQLAAAAKQASEDSKADGPEGEADESRQAGWVPEGQAAIEAAAAAQDGTAEAASWPPTADQITAGVKAAEARRSDPGPAEAASGPAAGDKPNRLPGRPPRHAGRSS